jgi:hypothetical protein
MYGNPAMSCSKYQLSLYGSEAITYLNAIMFVSRVQGHNQHYASVPPPPTPPQVHNVESHNLLEI